MRGLNAAERLMLARTGPSEDVTDAEEAVLDVLVADGRAALVIPPAVGCEKEWDITVLGRMALRLP